MPYTMNDVVTGEAKIKIIGVGGAGGNAINNMVQNNLEGVQFFVANTDKQALEKSLASVKIQLGEKITNGLGAGANPEIGKKAAEECTDEIREALKDSDMVFIAAGMGGGTGTGAAPVIAKISKELGALTVGVVTKPFRFEGRRRMRLAEEGLKEFQKTVDALIVIPNDKLLSLSSGKISIKEGFLKADSILLNAAQGITELIIGEGYVNVDFMDVRSVMSDKGRALMGIGTHKGENAAVEAVKNAISSPLLEDVSMDGATGVLVNFTINPNLSLQDIYEAADLVESKCNEDANVIWGTVLDETLDNEVKVNIIATGFEKYQAQVQPQPQNEFEDSTPLKAETGEHAVPPVMRRNAKTAMNYELFNDGRSPSTPELPSKKHTSREMPAIGTGGRKMPARNSSELAKPAYIRNLESSRNIPTL